MASPVPAFPVFEKRLVHEKEKMQESFGGLKKMCTFAALSDRKRGKA